MNWIENLLILVGISLDIFAGMECQGSLVAKIDKKHLTLVCGLIVIWQLAALYIGNVLDRKSTRLNSRSHVRISYAVFCLKKKKKKKNKN